MRPGYVISPECEPHVRGGARYGRRCTNGTSDCCNFEHVDLTLCGHLDPLGSFRPRTGWRDDQSPWWCSRCQSVRYGLYSWMHGGCPSLRGGERCGTILERLTP